MFNSWAIIDKNFYLMLDFSRLVDDEESTDLAESDDFLSLPTMHFAKIKTSSVGIELL